MANYGLLKERLQQPKQAEKAYREAIGLYGDTLGRPCHPNLIDAMANLGSLLRQPKTTPARRAEAGKLLEKALRLGIRVRGASHVLVGNDQANYARWLYDAGKLREARKGFATAIDIYERNVSKQRLDPDHAFIAEAKTWLGRVLVEENTVAAAKQALPLLADAVAKWPVQRGPGTIGEGVAKALLGRALWLTNNQSPEACRYLCEGYRLVRGQIDPAFQSRIETWIKQQGCDCEGAPLAAV
jgi:tetratricopeptide (TPR) repeat protein